LSDRDLEWYIENAEKSLADQNKAQFHATEQKRLAAYKAELKHRDDEAAGAPPDDDLPT
jgi:hypothetical protein